MPRSSLWSCSLALVMACGTKVADAPPQTPTPPDDPGKPSPTCEVIDPGRVTLHRLNRAEYDNTVRDLLQTSLEPAKDFPADDHGHGFDNNADVLATSPLLVEKYDLAAEKLVQEVFPPIRNLDRTFEAESDAEQDRGSQRGDGYVLITRGGVRVRFDVQVAAEYELSVRAYQDAAGPDPARMRLSIDGNPIILVDVNALRANPEVYRTRTRLQPGNHTFEAFFTNDFYVMEPRQDRNLWIDYLRVRGPYGAEVPSSDAKQAILTCTPTAGAAWDTCASQVVTALGRRAWRRPLTPEEVDRLVTLVNVARSENDPFDVGVGLALQAMLLSPHFVFRVELDPDPTSPTPHALTDHELATRLSYFLWSSMPDAELSRLADEGAISDPLVLTQQVRRMIRDDKAKALVDNFAGQWLYTRALDDVNPDYAVYPDFDAELQRSMRAETEAFFAEFLTTDRSALDMFDADFTYLNDRLARHYGLDPVGTGTVTRTVLPPGGQRGGLLTQAGLLTVTSYPKRTSPVKRGKWVLDELLCEPPPAPPPGVEGLIDEETMPTGSLRERMEEHRANPACAGCHSSMDPIGFGLQEFDGIGVHRTEDRDNYPIDSTGELPDGRTFDGAKELSTILKEDDRTARCFTERMLIYALGRGMGRNDGCNLDAITESFESRGASFEDLINSITESPAFTMRRGETGDQ